MSTTHPPELTYEITHNRRLRFTVTAAVVNQQITFQNLLDLILIATTAIAPYDLYDLVKIRMVTVWSQAALGTPTTVQCVFNTSSGDRSIHTDTSLGIRPACVHARPSTESLASFYTNSGGGAAFQITAPAGSIIDLDLNFRDTPGAGVAAANASVGATVGSVFYRGLDGLAAAGSNFPVPTGISSF